MTANSRIGPATIFTFWAPLAATWLMMASEGPFLAAVIARLADPKFNLAAHGVAFAVAIIVEAPIIMMLGAATALVDGAGAFRKLRNFSHALNLLITLFMALMLFSPGWGFLARDVIGLPEPVARLTQLALTILLPWPAAIGYRRFHQGLLIRHDLTRRVAYGTVVRLSAMAVTATVLYTAFDVPGACVGAAALSAGVCCEALAVRLMARGVVRTILSGATPPAGGTPLTYRKILSFYYPLALTSTVSLAVHPLVTFFMGRAPYPLESLAVLPVIIALVFIFRSLGLSYQEVAIALLARNRGNFPPVARFAAMLAAFSAAALALMAATPLAELWFREVSGLSLELTRFAIPPLRILALIPALSVLLSLQRAILVHGRRTAPITWSSVVEVVGIVAVLLLTIGRLEWVGATAAAVAFLTGRLAANLLLIPPCLRIVRGMTRAPETHETPDPGPAGPAS